MITPFRTRPYDGRTPRHRLHRRRRRTAAPTVFSATIFRLRPRLEVMEDRTLLSTFLVSNTSDIGTGSLRQAILDSNAAIGTTNTIDFDISGIGVQTIVSLSALPAITNPVLIDGFSQPSYSGTPLIAIDASSSGMADGLTITASNVMVRGLVNGRFALGSGNLSGELTVQSGVLQVSDTGTAERVATYRIDTRGDGRLLAQLRAQGLTTRLSLLDFQGRALVESDGVSPTNPDDQIDQHLAAGTYFLQIVTTGSAGEWVLTAILTPASPPFQAIPVGLPQYGNGGFDPLAVVDINGDGIPDLAAMDGVHLGLGDGTFREPLASLGLSAGDPALQAIISGDFNGDGKLDLVVQDAYFGTISVLLGNGDGTFQPPTSYSVGTSSVPLGAGTTLVAGDFSGNGRLDLVVANGGSNDVSVLMGNGDGTFQNPVTYSVGSDPSALVVGDFKGDGRLDLAVANRGSNDVSVLMGNGDGTFQNQVTYAVGSSPSALVAGDFNGAGRLDLAAANEFSGGISVLIGKGDGIFQGQVTYAVGGGGTPSSLVAGDFTGDGRLDLAAADYNIGIISVLQGNGDGTFQAPETIAPGVLGFSLVAGDFNGDGGLDLATADYDSNYIAVLLNEGDAKFVVQQPTAVGAIPNSVVTGDFTGDGRLDLAVANLESNVVSVLLGNGDGTFQAQQTFAAGFSPYALVAGDFNGDGRLDLAVAGVATDDTTGEISVLLGNGAGTFQAPETFADGLDSSTLMGNALVAGDFTGDGKLDLAVGDANYNSVTNTFGGEVSVLLGNGDGTFQPEVAYAVEDGASSIVAGDFTGDGHLDLATASEFSNDISVLMGNGDGTFQAPEAFAAGSNPSALVAGDFNDDGKIDLAESGDGMNMLPGNGDGTFQAPETVATGYYSGLAAGDFNADGKVDLAGAISAGRRAGHMSVLLGNGNGTFRVPTTYAVGADPVGLVAADFNGDGNLDLAVASQRANDISVLLGNGDGTFADPSQFATAPHATPLLADANSDGTSDVLVVDAAGNILYRQGIPGQSGAFEPPKAINPGFPSRDITWAPDTIDGPLLASVDAHDDGVSLFAYRDGGFVRVGSLTTGQLPAQIVAADLTGIGWDGLVVRNAGDGTLSVFFAKSFIGPISPLDAQFGLPAFLPPVTLPVGLGVSDVQAVDTTASGRLDLVVTNKLTSQVSVLNNLGNGIFAPPVPYRAGTGLSEIDPASTPEVTSLDETAGVAAGPLTSGGPASLVTINPGSNTVDVLAGLGQGRFANPVALYTGNPAQVVRVGSFTGNRLDDLAVLTSDGVSIYLANGQGGFLPPTTYAVPSESDGLTLADLTHNGKLDLLVGDAYGDVLVLLGNGNGTFEPYHQANQSVELAVADLTGNGSKDIIYADQGLDRVVVDYGAGSSSVLANQSTGLLEPGAVALADLNGDGIPDLIVANSGSNNVLIYPGLGDGQFGPAINDGNGYFVGTNPVGITVANLAGALPDVVVADQGSNQVSILLNQSQPGGAISFSAGPRLNSGGVGPVSTVVGNFTGGAFPDLLVTNGQSNDVTLLQGVGQGFFNDTNPRTYSVGTDPGSTFVGNFNGQTDLLTVNAGSNDLTLISDFTGSDPVTSTIASGGIDPDAAFAFADGSGFEDLLVGNAGDGELALFEGGADGLGLAASASEANLPDPTALAFSALTGGQVQFYAATAGRESAELVAFSLGSENGVSSSFAGSFSANSFAQLVPLSDSSLPLVATVLTFTLAVPGDEFNLGLAETEAAFLSGTGATVGQGLSSQGTSGPGGDDGTVSDVPQAAVAGSVPTVIAPWERFVIGLDRALKQFWRDNPNGVSGAPARDAASDPPSSPTPAVAPAQGGPTSLKSGSNLDPSGGEPDRTENASPGSGVESIDAAVHAIWGDDTPPDRPVDAACGEPWLLAARTEPRPPMARTEPRPSGFQRTAAIVLEPGNDQPDLALTPLVVAVLAARWRLERRANETAKPTLEPGSHGWFRAFGRARLRPSRISPPEPGGRRSARAERLEYTR